MDANEAQTAYKSLKAQLDAGKIPIDDYNRKAGELRYQDNTGTWWAVSPADGSWLKWTGSAWVPAFAQAVPSVPQAPVQQVPQPAVQHPVAAQPAEKPSWYIPPVGSGQQKPAATEPAAAQPVQQPVHQPAPQPASSSYYIPPSGSAQQPAVHQPATVVVQPAAAAAAKPGRNWVGIGSLVLGILSWIIYPVLLGIMAVAAGIVGLYMAKKHTSKLPITAIIGIIVGLLAIIINIFWLVIFPPPQLLPPIR